MSLIVAPVLEEDLKEIHNNLGLSSFLNFSDVSLKLGKYERRNLIAAPSTIKVSYRPKQYLGPWLPFYREFVIKILVKLFRKLKHPSSPG